jgi:hypothetical protein
MGRVAILIAVDEVCSEFSQVVRSDRLIAHHTQGPRAGRPPIHQNESHVTPPCDGTRIISTRHGRLPEQRPIKTVIAQTPCSRNLN